MENQQSKNCEPSGKHEYLLSKHHDCTKHIGRGCRALESALKGLNQPLAYANKWKHHEDSDRVGVLFYDMLQSRNRWISVPVSVFNSGEWDEFATKYCRIGDVCEKSNAVVVGEAPTIDLHQTPIPWNVKYKEEHLLPCEVTQGRMNRLLKCVGGEVIYLRWCGTFRNERGESEVQLDDTCQRLYSWNFARVRSNWIARLGKLEDWWDLFELVKVGNDGND